MHQYKEGQAYESTDVNKVQGKEAMILTEAWPTLANKRQPREVGGDVKETPKNTQFHQGRRR